MIDAKLAHTLHLPTQDLETPYLLGWIDAEERQAVNQRAFLTFRIGDYSDSIWFNMVDIASFHACLGRPWQYDRSVTHHGRENIYTFIHRKEQVILRPHSHLVKNFVEYLDGVEARDWEPDSDDEFAAVAALDLHSTAAERFQHRACPASCRGHPGD